MRLILETFQAIEKNEGGRKLVVLADMLELGNQSAELHAKMIESLNFEILDKVYLYGPMMKSLYQVANGNPNVSYFTDLENLSATIKKKICNQMTKYYSKVQTE